MSKILSFDIEINDIFDLKPYEDMEKYAPFHISTGATVVHEGEEKAWYSLNKEGKVMFNLTQRKAHVLLRYLRKMQRKGFMVCSWNGLSFDLKWIGYHAQDMKLAAEIALNSYDPMFQFFNEKGFPVKLIKVAKAMGIKEEKLMDSSDAPIRWAKGDYKKVMEYCINDCVMTNSIVAAILIEKEIRWINRDGNVSSTPIPRLKVAKEVISDDPPDQSWLGSPIPKRKFYRWVEDYF